MPTDKFWAELPDISPEQFKTVLTTYVSDMFAPELRGEAIEQYMQTLFALRAGSEEDDVPKLLPFGEFLASVGEPPPAIAEGFLPANKLYILSGNPKEGKSLVALQILEDVCTGEKLLGHYDIDKPGCVAYFGMEDGGYEIKTRLTTRGITDLPNYYICDTPFDMRSEAGWQMFLSLIKGMTCIPDLLVIDTAREAFVGIRDWNDAALVGPALKNLRRWAQKNCTVILICHNNKDKFASGVGKVSGSSALTSSSDIVAILENQKVLENGDLTWDYEMTGRGIKKTTAKLRMDTETLRVRKLEDEEAEQLANKSRNDKRQETKQSVLAAAEQTEGEFTAQTLADKTGLSDKYCRAMLMELAGEGLVNIGKKERQANTRTPVQFFFYGENCTIKREIENTPLDSNSISVLNGKNESAADTRSADMVSGWMQTEDTSESEEEEYDEA